jgi:hypothetical protein
MATNRTAVTTTVTQIPAASFIDINRIVALTSDTATFADDYKLYTALEDVGVDFADTDPEYLMAEKYFGMTGGSGYFYVVPVRLLDVADPDIISTLTQLENDPTLTFAMVTADKTIRASAQVTDGSLATAKYDAEYHMIFETDDATTITSGTTDPVSVNKAIYDGLTGDNAKLIGNMSFVYIEDEDDYQASSIAGAMLGEEIGSRTAKFIEPLGSTPITLTGAELQFLMDKNCNVYTGTNERTGRAFVKEGVCLKADNFIDTSLGAIWVDVNLTAECYDLLSEEKVSIDSTGFALLENAVNPVFVQAQNQGIIQAGKGTYSISFAADPAVTRGIIGTYSYNEATAGHFVTNNVRVQ